MQEKRLKFLIEYLIGENPKFENIKMPSDENSRKNLLRSLMNVRPAKPIGDDFLLTQDEYLQGEIKNKGIIGLEGLTEVNDGIYLWKGDITTLQVDGIVNAANSGLTGCYNPCHNCIDNVIHTYGGVQLRLECSELMKNQGHDEEIGKAKITNGYNLPSRYVIHTVGPMVMGSLTKKECEQLESCYKECLKLADASKLESIAFCCISTGEYQFPNMEAAKIAIKTVRNYLCDTNSKIKVVFNVYKEEDFRIYKGLLEQD